MFVIFLYSFFFAIFYKHQTWQIYSRQYLHYVNKKLLYVFEYFREQLYLSKIIRTRWGDTNLKLVRRLYNYPFILCSRSYATEDEVYHVTNL